MKVYHLVNANPGAGKVVRVLIIAPTVGGAEAMMDNFNLCHTIRDPSGSPILMSSKDDWGWTFIGLAHESDNEPRIVDYYYHY